MQRRNEKIRLWRFPLLTEAQYVYVNYLG
eukprot:SAG22_NODE_17943_length_296_cov_0.751269_1_plen_28_part_10